MNFLYIANRVISFFVFFITMIGVLWFADAVGVAGYDAINILMLLLISFYPRSIIINKYSKIFVFIAILFWGYFIVSHSIEFFYSKGFIPTFDILKFAILLIGFTEVITKKGNAKDKDTDNLIT